jgi:hypothetical protein
MKINIFSLATVLACSSCIAHAVESRFEQPPNFEAAKILPSHLLKSPYHRVDAKVSNDGKMNHYAIKSKLGNLTADSTAELKIRVDEMKALAAMKKVSNSDQFVRQVKQGGKNVVDGTKALVTAPVKTVKGVFVGLGTLVERTGDALMGDPPSDAEDSRVENVIGFSSTKRDYAAEFHVDPYSTNPLLQKRLEELAWYGYSGKITASAATAVIPGGVGTFVSVAKSSDWLEGIPVQTPPTDLRNANRAKLTDMDVSEDVIDLFLGNTVYSPIQQTKLVQALAKMNGTGDRGRFVKFAVLARDANVAFFRAQQAEMYAKLHKSGFTIDRFIGLGNNVAARLSSDVVVMCFPVDYLSWTESNAKLAMALDKHISALPGLKGKEIRLAGGISPQARQALQSLGWKVLERLEAM